jgi:hypothetical protein
LSITQTIIENKEVKMKHYDLINQNEFENSFIFV